MFVLWIEWDDGVDRYVRNKPAQWREVCMTHNGKALFAGVGEASKPGSIEIYKVAEDPGKNQLKMDLINQVQAHS